MTHRDKPRPAATRRHVFAAILLGLAQLFIALPPAAAQPLPLSLERAGNRPTGTLIESEAVTLVGTGGAVSVTVQDGEYSINGGPYTIQPGTIQLGQTLSVRRMSSPYENTIVTARVTVGGVANDFEVGTRYTAAQPQPDGSMLAVIRRRGTDTAQYNLTRATTDEMGFTAQGRFRVSQGDTFEFLARGPFDGPLAAGDFPMTAPSPGGSIPYLYASGMGACSPPPSVRQGMKVHEAEYDANGLPTKLAVDFYQWCSGYSFSQVMLGHIRLNSTEPIDYASDRVAEFKFPSVRDAEPGSDNTSTQRIYGPTGFVPVTVTGGEYAIDNGPFTSLPGAITHGQDLSVRARASLMNGSIVEATVTVGGEPHTFRIATCAADRLQPTPSHNNFVAEIRQTKLGEIRQKVYEAASFYDLLLGYSLNSPSQDRLLLMHVTPTEPPIPFLANPVINVITARAANGEFLVPGTYVVGDSPLPGENTVSTDPHHGCKSDRRFVIHEIAYDANGLANKLALDYRANCFGATYGMGIFLNDDSAHRLYVRINSNVPIDYTLRQPVRFDLGVRLGQVPGAVVVSNEITVLGIEMPLPISITGGEYSIDGGPYTNSPGMVSLGQRVKVRTTAGASGNQLVTARLQIGELAGDFKVATAVGIDPQPNGGPLAILNGNPGATVGIAATIVISPVTQGEISATYLSYFNAVELSLRQAPEPPTSLVALWSVRIGTGNALVPGRYTAIAGNTDASSPFLTFNGDCGSSPASELTLHEATVSGSTVVSLAVDFITYCRSQVPVYGYIRINSTVPIVQVADFTPLPFNLGERRNVAAGTLAESNPVLLQGFNRPLAISIANGEYSLDGGPFTSVSGTANAGQTLRVRATAPAAPGAMARATLALGSQSFNFDVYSVGTDNEPDLFNFLNVSDVPLGQVVVSQPVVITGINVPLTVEAPSGEVSIDNGPFSSNPGNITAGQSLRARIAAPLAYDTSTYAFVLVGNRAASFSAFTSNTSSLTVHTNGSGTVIIPAPARSCELPCSGRYVRNSTVTLVVQPGSGSRFTGWSGACTGTGTCNVLIDNPRTVTATFATTQPDAPVITTATAGNGQVAIAFAAPANTGGAPVTSYRATCQPGNVTATGLTQPLVVTGLANGTAYQCTVAAGNAVGFSAESSPLTATPSAAVPLSLLDVSSRITHGNGVVLDLPLDSAASIAGAVTIDPRTGAGGPLLVFRFNAPVTAPGTVTAIDGASAAVTINSATPSGHELHVALPLLEGRRVAVTLAGVNGSLTLTVAAGFLPGDVDSDGSVSDDDLRAVKARSGEQASVANLRYDINASGRIGAADVMAVKARRGRMLQ